MPRRSASPFVRSVPAHSTDADPRADPALLTAIAGGELTALGILYDRYARDIWRVASRVTGGASDVEDIVHATFLKLPELASGYDGRPCCRNWLSGIAVRIALRRGRSLWRFTRVLSRFAEQSRHTRPLDPEVLAGDRQDLAHVERALQALPESKRAVVILVEVEGLSHAEVAHALGIPLATVRTRLFWARNALREALGRGGEGGEGGETCGRGQP